MAIGVIHLLPGSLKNGAGISQLSVSPLLGVIYCLQRQHISPSGQTRVLCGTGRSIGCSGLRPSLVFHQRHFWEYGLGVVIGVLRLIVGLDGREVSSSLGDPAFL